MLRKSFKTFVILSTYLSFTSCKSTRTQNEDKGLTLSSFTGEVSDAETLDMLTVEEAITPDNFYGTSPVNKNLNAESMAIDTIPLSKIETLENATSYAFYQPHFMRTPLTFTPVRHKKNGVRHFQEAVTYSFLMNNPKFPAITKMNDGTFVLSISAEVEAPKRRDGFLLTSKDGMAWTNPKKLSTYRLSLMNGGSIGLVFVRGHQFELTGNFGDSFHSGQAFPTIEGKTCDTDVAYDGLVEGYKLRFLCWFPVKAEKAGDVFTQAALVTFDFHTGKWEEPYIFPREWGLNEGSLIRAENGDLIAAFRTQMVGVAVQNDHYMGLATSISKDDGKTWSLPKQHFAYGRHHVSLLKLNDKRILMTYAVRLGQLDGRPYHGVEAVISDDNGETWNWDERYIIARTENSTLHSPHSVVVNDNKILTVYMYDSFFSWNDSGKDLTPSHIPLAYHGNVSVVIWEL